MSKGKKNAQKIVAKPTIQSMYVLAGLPKDIYVRAIEILEKRFPHSIFKGVPASSRDGQLYGPRTVEALVRSMAGFAVRRRTNGNAQPTPKSITLLFVPSPDQEVLLRAVDFAVLVTQPLDPGRSF